MTRTHIHTQWEVVWPPFLTDLFLKKVQPGTQRLLSWLRNPLAGILLIPWTKTDQCGSKDRSERERFFSCPASSPSQLPGSGQPDLGKGVSITGNNLWSCFKLQGKI